MARFDSLKDWLSWQEGFHPRSIDLGLERATHVFNALQGDALKPPTIIVAGTNGKGSCIAFLEEIYRAQGYRVGSYTSPHILRYNERIRIDGQSVSDTEICDAFERIDAVRDEVSLSYFEFGTLAALDVFSHSNLDLQILEVGLGGRLDAVNIIDSDVSLITSVCIDHIDWLGETREAIAYEKAGIFRTDVPAIIGDMDPPCSLLNCANEVNTPLFCINQEFSYQVNENGCWDWSGCLKNKSLQYHFFPAPALKGKHQYGNAATVIMAITQMQSLMPVSEDSIRKGLKTVQLKGRFQLIEDDVPILLDVAHNPQAVTALFNYINDAFSGKNIHAVFSMMKDKDIVAVIDIIKPVISHWYFASLSISRAVSESVIQQCFTQCGIKNVTLDGNDTAAAYNAAKTNAKLGDLILVFGSFFLVSEFLELRQ
ncbi:MAG: bifunctional tetrahydrofolate synthase/dihydrofolate synthase [Methylococcales symbiont of Hymedesmia sp. n. MRB-2018]|nr:MAG: bifunctional tetrahydrofolate synthase/dihydrofolate synthase [Methylococcales symbiont of Hymedesmia sp. n. MRB-2018]